MLLKILKTWLAEPSTQGLALDDPNLTMKRKDILANKAFLRAIYQDWYQLILEHIPPGPGKVLELGSGPSFFGEDCPQSVTSDLFWLEGIDLVMDALSLPFRDQSLKAIVMTNVLHHIPQPRCFLAEASRCLRPEGVVVLVEPWYTPWSGWVYGHLHHEPFDSASQEWEFPPAGPLSGANGALPWILFERDRPIFEKEFPSLAIKRINPMMPLRYLVSGGLSMRSLSPARGIPARWSQEAWKALEKALQPLMKHIGMFALVVLSSAPTAPSLGKDQPAPKTSCW